MRMDYCPNCRQRVGFRRALGWGTFFAAVLTLGFWLLTLPFYALRCVRCGEALGADSDLPVSDDPRDMLRELMGSPPGRVIIGVVGVGILILIVVFAIGCASVPLAPVYRDQDAKRFSAPSDRAAIYVVRDGIYAGPFLGQVSLDGRIVGGLATETYFAIRVQPGAHQVMVMGEGGSDMLSVVVSPGRCYFVRLYVTIGPRWHLETLSESDGHRAVTKSALAAAFD